jgi:hypothetical protein
LKTNLGSPSASEDVDDVMADIEDIMAGGVEPPSANDNNNNNNDGSSSSDAELPAFNLGGDDESSSGAALPAGMVVQSLSDDEDETKPDDAWGHLPSGGEERFALLLGVCFWPTQLTNNKQTINNNSSEAAPAELESTSFEFPDMTVDDNAADDDASSSVPLEDLGDLGALPQVPDFNADDDDDDSSIAEYSL